MSQRLFDALHEIAPRVAQAPQLLLCLDYDGTLTEIVDDPAKAFLDPATHDIVARLAGLENITVAIVSGRARSDLLARIELPGLIYGGNHGLEISGPGFLFIEPTAAGSRDQLHTLAKELTNRLSGIPGALVEDKGLTLSVHDRRVPAEHLDEVRRLVHATLANSRHPFQLTPGDRIFDIRPRVPWDKGVSVSWIRKQVGHPDALVIYLGDDATDEDAFAALRDGITVKVGPNEETVARYRLDSCHEVRQFLQWLLSARSGGLGARSGHVRL
jgi:trehalose 6-phosphate phosphatase